MNSVLISITSHKPKPELDKVMANYLSAYRDYNIKIVLACNYHYQPTDIRVQVIPSTLTGPNHAWNNRSYIADTYHHWDYIIESDDDILVPLSTFEHYCKEAEGMPLDNIPSVLSVETKEVNGLTELVVLPSLKFWAVAREKANGYFVPFYNHSACFIADKERYRLALEKGMAVKPETVRGFHIQEWARSQIYYVLKPQVSIAEIEQHFVYHLPNRYIIDPLRREHFRTLEEIRAELGG